MRVLTLPDELVPYHDRCICVPTMGALHEGHASLIRFARDAQVGPVVVTIFVNPTQFGPHEDFTRYPRTLEQDIGLCTSAGAEVVFAPDVETIYPHGTERDPIGPAHAPLPAVATEPQLEDRFRPGHFAGVCRVVRRLFDLIRPSHAVFGEKDYQQLRVIEAMTALDGRSTRIIGRPTVRDPDGLAMSSRNRYLSASERRAGLAISRALMAAREAPTVAIAEERMHAVLAGEASLSVEYAVVRDAATLMPVSPRDQARTEGPPLRGLIAARAGSTRLIDNMPIGG